ncbi:MAG TPA: cyclic nucleotide-binding domain-containing protein [Candidatus Ozemobacteraceae bacterium]|nr:cyclic nucleotide-binding domain-containing protein [Candidatus Ozemobacteraceae bacterium]
MITIEKILFLKRISIFKSLSSQELRMVAEVVTEEEFAAGEVLFQEGQLGDCMYLVVEGRVAIITGLPPKFKTLAVFESGDFFGEMGLYDDKPRAATAMAREASRLLVLRKNDFCELISEYPEVALGIMKELNQRLRDTNMKLRSFEGQMIDKSTQLYSRDYFIECMATEFLKAKKENFHLAFVVAGCSVAPASLPPGPAADEAREQLVGGVGRVFTTHQRPTDLTARLGEGKAVILLCEADREGAGAFQRRIRKDLDRLLVGFRESHGRDADLTFSVFVFPDDSQEREAMLSLLDKC